MLTTGVRLVDEAGPAEEPAAPPPPGPPLNVDIGGRLLARTASAPGGAAGPPGAAPGPGPGPDCWTPGDITPYVCEHNTRFHYKRLRPHAKLYG